MKVDFSSIEFQSVIEKCIQNDPAAWDRFFAIFTPRIIRYIVNALLVRHQDDLARDDDIMQEIYIDVVEAIYKPAMLQRLINPLAIGAYLKTTSVRKVIDFCRKRQSQKALSLRAAESTMLSMDSTPLEDSDSHGLHEVLSAPGREERFDDLLIEVETEITGFCPLWKWVVLLKTVYYNPLDGGQILALSEEVNVPETVLRDKIAVLMDSLAQKNDGREKDLSNAEKYKSVITHLKNRLKEAVGSATLYTDAMGCAFDEIHEKAERMHALARKGELDVTPTNEQIADILNIPAEKAQQVSTHLARARKKLRDMGYYQKYRDALRVADGT